MQFKSFGFSDSGKVRHNNEDSYLCNETESLFLVADGMGGHTAGDVASRLAVTSFEEFIIQSRSEDIAWPVEYQTDWTLEQNRLFAAAMVANRRIHEASDRDHSMDGMGTTLVGATAEEDHLAVINIGDSRLYQLRGDRIKQITKDHTLVGQQQRDGILTKEEAKKHPQRHILTSSLGGIRKTPQTDISLVKIEKNDLYLFCSDGLSNMLDDNEISSIINSVNDRSLYKIGLSLVLKANLAGGTDNITVVLLSF